jgi:glucose/arabinose dehydrogenase
LRNLAAKLVVGVAVTTIGMYGADVSVGTWKYNAAKSKTTSAQKIKSQTDLREATSDGGMKITRTAELADGTTVNFSFTFKYDGKPYPVTGGPFDIISAKRIDANTTSFEAKKTGGKFHLTGQTVISKDGKTLTQTATGTNAAGKPVTSTLVFDKK